MIDHRAWDACELSLSSYIMAKARGAALTALPIFPRRLYSQSQMYVNTEAGIHEPRDLIGKRVGLRSFQTTLSVLAKGDLHHEYDVPLDQVTWVTSAVEPVPFEPPAGVCIEWVPDDKNIDGLACNRKNLERFIQYELDQGLIDRRLEVEDLFHEATHTT